MGKHQEKKIQKMTLKHALTASEIRYRTKEERIAGNGRAKKYDRLKSALSQL